jgi:predicted dehydrogenase
MRIAFVGGAGHHYLRRLLPGDHAVAVVTDPFDAPATDAMADGLPLVTERFDDVGAMLRSFRPHVVSVGVVYAHGSDAIATCLRHGVPTVADKPVAAGWAAYGRLAELCAASPGASLVTEFDFRARPAFRAARDAVLGGRVGAVALVTGQKSYRWGSRPAWYAQRQHYGSTLLWIASHAIDALRFVTGVEPVCVHARQANVTRGPQWGTAEDVAVATFALPNGGSAVVHADFLRPAAAPTHGDDRLRVAGDRGVIEVVDDRCTLTTADAPPVDITDTASSRGVAHELLEAALNGGNEFFSTAESLRTAKLLLEARDLADVATT